MSQIPLDEATGRRPLADLVGAGITVPLVQGGEARYVNLDYAASAPSLAQVVARVTEVLPWYASVHRGSGYLSLVSTALYESARATVRQFVGARDDDVVIFTRNTTDGLNLLMRAVPSGTEVVYLDIEHHADILPWQRHLNHCVRAGATWAETAPRLEQALEEHPGALLAITGASNVTGELVPLSAVVALAHERGARVAVDAAQLAPHRPIDLSRLGADYLAFSGHKCYAPFGVGVLVGRRDWLDDAPAYLAGGGAVETVTIETTNWARSPERHEGGTPNFVGAVALAEASLVLTELFGSGAVEAQETVLRQRLLAGLEPLEGVGPANLAGRCRGGRDRGVRGAGPRGRLGRRVPIGRIRRGTARWQVLRPSIARAFELRAGRSTGQLRSWHDDRRYRPADRGAHPILAQGAGSSLHAP